MTRKIIFRQLGLQPRRLFTLLVPLLLLAAITPAPAAQVTIKFSHVVATDTPKGQAALYFKRLVEQKSKGTIRVEVYPNASLYSDHEAIEALSLNVLQMAAPAFAKFTRFVPELQLFDLPFLFENTRHLHRVLDGNVGRALLRSVSKRGLVGLGFWDNGFKQLTANRPLVYPADAVGLKFRIMNSMVLARQFRALGAQPEVLPFAEVYGALQHKTIDGQENTLSNIYSKKFYEVQKDLSLTNHGYLGYLVVTNQLFWNQLTDRQKEIITSALQEATAYIRGRAAELNRQSLKSIRFSGKTRIHDLTPEQRHAWQTRLRKIYPEFYDTIGRKLIEDTVAAEQ